MLGFDFNGGRLDVSAHPFCGGVPEDVRITTRYDENELLSALFGVIHETGHARYEQNLPRTWSGQPVALARSTAIHESQSLFFEMQLGRSEAFLKHLLPAVHARFGSQAAFSEENFIAWNQRVKPGYIRVDADEVSYPAHVVLRYEIERSLINGDIEVDDIPALWDEKNAGLAWAVDQRQLPQRLHAGYPLDRRRLWLLPVLHAGRNVRRTAVQRRQKCSSRPAGRHRAG